MRMRCQRIISWILVFSIIMGFVPGLKFNVTESKATVMTNSTGIADNKVPLYWIGEYDGQHGSTVVRRCLEIQISDIRNGSVEGVAQIWGSQNEEERFAATGSYHIRGTYNSNTGGIKLQGYEWIDVPVDMSGDEWKNFFFVVFNGEICDKGSRIVGTTDRGIWRMNAMESSNIDTDIISVVKKYTSNDILQGYKKLLEVNSASTVQQWNAIKNYFIHYNIFDLKEGTQYMTDISRCNYAYEALMEDDVYYACNFEDWLDTTIQGKLCRASLLLDNIFLNGEVFEWVNPFMYAGEETVGIKKYKATLLKFMEETEEKYTTENLLEQIGGAISDMRSDASDVLDSLNDVEKMYVEAKLKSAEKLYENAKTRQDAEKILKDLKSALEDNSEINKKVKGKLKFQIKIKKTDLENKIDDLLDGCKISFTAVEDLYAFFDVSSRINTIGNYYDFLMEIGRAGNELPFELRVAAVQLASEIEKSYLVPIQKTVLDAVDIVAGEVKWKDAIADKILSEGAQGFIGNLVGTFTLANFIVNLISKCTIDAGALAKKSCDVECYVKLARFYKTKLANAKLEFRSNQTEENALEFCRKYELLYELRVMGEKTFRDMRQFDGILADFFEAGKAKTAVVDDVLDYLEHDVRLERNIVQYVNTQYKQKSIIHCPVNVRIYDENNNLVCTMEDQKESLIENSYGRFQVVKEIGTDEYVKVAYFNDDKKYRIEIDAVEPGTVRYEYSKVDESNEYSEYASDDIEIGGNSVVTTETDSNTCEIDYDGDGSTDGHYQIYDGVDSCNLFYDSSCESEVSNIVLWKNGSSTVIDGLKMNFGTSKVYTSLEKSSVGKLIVGVTTSKKIPIIRSKNRIDDVEARRIAKASIDSEGKITVKPGSKCGEVYLWVMDSNDASHYAYTKIIVKQAPRVLKTYHDTEKEIHKETVKYTKASLSIGESTGVYLNPTRKGNEYEPVEDSTYSVIIPEKYKDCLEVTQISNFNYQVKATGLLNNKPTRAYFFLKCDQNNRKTRFYVTIYNKIRSVEVKDKNYCDLSETTPAAVKVSGDDTLLRLTALECSEDFKSTDRLKIYIIKSKDDLSVSQRGKLVVKNRVYSKLKVTFSKDRKNIFVSSRKGVKAGEEYYIAFVYNTKNTEYTSGYKIVKLVVEK